MSATPRRVRVAEAFPEMIEQLDPEQRELATARLVADLMVLRSGPWTPPPSHHPPGHLGLLVLDGLMSREISLERPLASELVGRGDLLRPTQNDGEDAPIPFAVSWTVLHPTRIAVLDPRFAQALGYWPPAVETMIRGMCSRAHSLAVTMAVSNLRRVDTRVMVLLWHLADRWGRVTPEGVVVPLRLTHETLARLVGAQRPSVTAALHQLADQRRLSRTRDRAWVLHGVPPETLSRLDTAVAL